MRLRHMIFVTTALVSVAGTAHAQDVTAAAQSSSATTPGSSDDIVVTSYRKSLQDAIATKRFDEQTGADREVQRILIELLTQMDGFDQTVNVKVSCACVSLRTDGLPDGMVC